MKLFQLPKSVTEVQKSVKLLEVQMRDVMERNSDLRQFVLDDLANLEGDKVLVDRMGAAEFHVNSFYSLSFKLYLVGSKFGITFQVCETYSTFMS